MSRHLQTLFLLAVLSFLFVIPTQAQVTTASIELLKGPASVCHPDTSTGNNSQYEWNSYVSR